METVFDGFISVKDNDYFLSTKGVARDGMMHTDVINPSVYTVPEPQALLEMVKSDVQMIANIAMDERMPYHDTLDKLISSAEDEFLAGVLDQQFLSYVRSYLQQEERTPGERYFSMLRGTATVAQEQYPSLVTSAWDDIADSVTEKYFIDIHLIDDALPEFEILERLVKQGVRTSMTMNIDIPNFISAAEDEILKTVQDMYGYISMNAQTLGTFYDATENRAVDIVVSVLDRIIAEREQPIAAQPVEHTEHTSDLQEAIAELARIRRSGIKTH